MFGWDDFGKDGKRGEGKIGGSGVWLGGEETRKMEGPSYFLSGPTKT